MSTTPLPIIRGTSTALYPYTQTYICNTGKADGQSSTATRWVKSPPIVRFEFSYDQLKRADKNTLRSFLASALGQFTTNLGATTQTAFTALSFDDDLFSAGELSSTQYSVKWSLTQTTPQNLSPGTSGTAFPTLSTGAISQLPYSQRQRFQTVVSKVPSGPKYTLAEFGGGLTNFPSTGRMEWEFQENALTDSEVATKIAHFLANWGDCFPFSFTDEDNTVYSNVYYASPQFQITRQSYNLSRITTGLVQMS